MTQKSGVSICEKCAHVGEMFGEGKPHSICRAHPPTVHMVFEVNELAQKVDKKVLNIFPSVPPDGLGCGEFTPRKEMENERTNL